MRILIAIAAVLAMGFAAAANADEVPAESRVVSVTVFLSGAEVTRAARLMLDKGEHVLVFNDLPAEAVGSSIRVDGKATARLDIQSVDASRRYIPRADQVQLQAERKRLEDEIERLRDERGLVQGRQDAAQTQKLLLTNLAQLPGNIEDKSDGTVPSTIDWTQILGLIGSGIPDAQKSALEAEADKRVLDRRIEDLEKKLAALAPARVQQTEVKVHVMAGAPLEADLTLRYQVRSASWRPRYDARLGTGSKTEPPRLQLTRRAEIRQRTGEAWDDVALELSTTRPTANAAAPELKTVTVDFEPEHKPSPAASPMPQDGLGGNFSMRSRKTTRMADAAAEAPAAPPPVKQDIRGQFAEAVTAPFQAVFSIPGRTSVPDTGEPKSVLLQEDDIEPVLTVRTVPKSDEKAYLYAKVVVPQGSPLLPGTASLFRDGTYIGTGNLPVLSPGEDYELGFGADDQVRVRHAVLNDKRGETGLISSSKTDSRKFRITVKNLHERSVALVVLDQVPVSKDQDIKVDIQGPRAPTRKDIDDERGVISFEAKLEPEEEEVIEFGYRVTWPGSRAIIYR